MDHKQRKIATYEIANMGAGIGGGIGHTQELNVKKYNKAMDGQHATKWAKQVAKEHGRMLKDKVWRPRLRGAGRAFKTITSTWAIKKKASGDRRARVNAQGFEQIPWVHYNPERKASPVVNMTTIRIILVLWASCYCWTMHLIDVCRAFLKCLKTKCRAICFVYCCLLTYVNLRL